MKKKKILYIHHSTGIGGAPISLIEIIKTLPSSEFEVEVLLLKQSDVCGLFEEAKIDYKVADHWFYKRWYLPYAHIEVGWVKIFQPLKFLYFSFSWLVSRFFGAQALLKGHKADIVHLNSYALTDFLCASAKIAKTVIHVREPATRGHLGIRQRIARGQIRKYASDVIAISKDNLARLKIDGLGHVIYNSFSPALVSSRLPSSLPNSVIYLGGASPHKGFLMLAAAAGKINPEISIKILGYIKTDLGLEEHLVGRVRHGLKKISSLEYRRTLQALDKLKALKNVELIGVVKNTEKYLEESRLLLNLFAITHFSRPIIESYAVGRGVIATDVDGIDEIVDAGLTGFLVKKNNPEALAELINRVALDDDLLDRIGKNASELAAARFSSKNVNKVIEIYDALLRVA